MSPGSAVASGMPEVVLQVETAARGMASSSATVINATKPSTKSMRWCAIF